MPETEPGQAICREILLLLTLLAELSAQADNENTHVLVTLLPVIDGWADQSNGRGRACLPQAASGEQHRAAGGEHHINNHAHHYQVQLAGMAVNAQHCKVQLAGTGMAVKTSIR